MLSARTIFEEILDNDEAFRLFCSIAASGEANWRRHLDTDLTATPSACAAPAFDIPSAHAKMIRARSARHFPGSPARRDSSARSSSDSTISAAEGPGCDIPTD